MGFLDVLEKVSPSVRTVRAQIPPYRAWWEEQNTEALAADGPVWVALGDSSAQGVGASAPDRGYVTLLLQGLRQDDPRWRVLNLSVSGKQVRDLVDHHLPAMEQLLAEHRIEPALVTAAIGGNDIVATPRPRLEADVVEMVDRLPEGTYVATLPQGLRPGKSRRVNTVLEAQAAQRGLPVVDLWTPSGRPWKGKVAADRFHPSDHGYRGIAQVFADAIGIRLPEDGART